jgi:putative serine protease PepD
MSENTPSEQTPDRDSEGTRDDVAAPPGAALEPPAPRPPLPPDSGYTFGAPAPPAVPPDAGVAAGMNPHLGQPTGPPAWEGGPYGPPASEYARPEAGAWQPPNPPGSVGPPGGGGGFPPGDVPAAPKGGGRRRFRSTIAVAGIAAVLGGLVGGGTVALTRAGNTTIAASVNRTSDSAQGTPTSTDGTVEGAAATISPSVVTLSISGGSADGTGSGVIVRADGYILTNNHVVSAAADGGTITATFADGRTATAKIVGTDASTDLAVVKVDGVSGLTAATFADSNNLKVGQSVVAVGSPLGLDQTVTSGIVSALHRATRGGDNNTAIFDAVQTDAPINPGNSGGPLVDLSGHVVGINAEIATAGGNSRFPGSSSSGNIGIGFAIPSDTAADIADQLIAKGSAQHAYLGVELSSNSSSAGAQLASVVSGGPAAKAGLQVGDVVTKIDGRLVTNSDDLAAGTRAHRPGDKVTLTIVRGGKTSTVTVTLGTDAKQ